MKKIAFIADSLDNAYKFQQVFAQIGAEVAAGSTAQIKKLLAVGVAYDLVVFEARASAGAHLGEATAFAEDRMCPLLVIIDGEEASRLQLPALVPSDFVVHGASMQECLARVQRLVRSDGAANLADVITVDGMTVNLATYQVSIGDDPIDFTYLEYALLSFLVRHPGHTFSRDALLQHVWGFDYYGGSRTVDVHVRRIRAKLGPELALHLETVRGVGYLWSA